MTGTVNELYLKALEMQGFKSFPDKTRLTFDKPVTAIVGPNGSGKSNISDAILWVMGEQSSRTLRGGKMEDVIFGGTQKRGPVGFAEVSLILDNSEKLFDMEESEVMITRRYYRSGESEYYINRRSGRLRDVSELLMDTGMGREGYSIIGQGRVDAILSARSGDRREIFEEAAGISRFRHRKEESERRLERTDENLVRINDKISELELQVTPLKSQAETAKKYLVLRDELRGLEISVWTDTLRRLGETSKKLEIDCQVAARELAAGNEELEKAYAEAERLGEQMREKDVEAEARRELISRAVARAGEYDSAARVLEARLESTLGERERIRRDMSEQASRDGGIRQQIGEKNARILEIDRERAALDEETEGYLRESESLLSAYGEQARQLSEAIAGENDAERELSDKKAELSSLAASAQELEDRDEAAAREAASNAEQAKALRQDAEKCAAELKKAREDVQSHRNMIAGHEKRVAARRQKSEDLGERQMKLTMEDGAIRSRISLLREMEKEYQGYSRAVKTVMQEGARGTLKNIFGTVAGLVSTSDKYALAIETALGGAMQDIIVGTEEDGEAAIQMLRRRDAGRATFLPVSAVCGRTLEERGLENEPGYEGVALQLVEYDPRYAGVYANLLGRTVVADTLKSAIAISRKYKNRFRIITLDGQVMNAGGSMTGGSAAKGAGIISRANELKRLGEQQARLSASLEAAEKQLQESKRELAAAEYELETVRGELRSVEDSALRLEADANHYALLLDAAEKSADALRTERETLRARIERNNESVAAVRAAIAEAGARAEEYGRRAAALTDGQEKLSAERERIASLLSRVRASLASLEAERTAVLSAIGELNALREDLSGGRDQQERDLQRLEGEIEGLRQEIADNRQSAAGENARAEELKKELETVSAEKLELDAQRTRKDRETQEKNRRILDLERESARLEQRKQAAELEEKQIVDKLWDTYELTRTAAMEQRLELESVPEAKHRIGELKRYISRLGTPNIGAIDEYERVNARYTYLTEQRDDVERSRNELLEIIGEITKEMKAIFAREFDAISESFRQTFLELFGGGKASLELEDDSDILNCGIEIRVQPPGKQLKTISLLSGGEKAFVAIALYFSILRIRPTPFVVMDEIEAALDEANVLRFAEYMRKMSDKTQMICITHRRGTMEEADMLYGVTMQEQGVSRILSIDIEDAERTINS